MDLLNQTLVMLRLNIMSLPSRAWPSAIIVVSTACVVGVLLSMLSETAGLLHAYQTGGSLDRAIVMPAETASEYGNGISRSEVTTITSAPGIARGSDGALAADAEILFWIPPTEGYKINSPDLRGIGPTGLSLHPELKIVSGRSFQAGRQELVIGVRAERVFGLRVGDKVILPTGEWPIVGAFTAGGSFLEAQLIGDAATIMSTSRISGFGSVLVKLDDARAFDEFKRWVTTNPSLTVTTERQLDYYQRIANQYSAFFTKLAYIVAVIMALGALFGSVKIMHTAVSARTREIGTLRALGYRPLPTAVAVVLEMVLLSLTGACLGAGIAWLLFNGRTISRLADAFELSVSPRLFLLGIEWAVALAVLSALPPAIRAARLSVVNALRET